MTLRLLKKLPITAPKVVREICLKKQTLKPNRLFVHLRPRLKSLLAIAAAAATIAVATPATLNAQAPSNYQPPVHVGPPQSAVERTTQANSVQPASYQGHSGQTGNGNVRQNATQNYLPPQQTQQQGAFARIGDSVAPSSNMMNAQQMDAAHAMHVAQLAAQMRMQNESAIARREAQINGARQIAPSYSYPAGYQQQQQPTGMVGRTPVYNQPNAAQQQYVPQQVVQQPTRSQPVSRQPQQRSQRPGMAMNSYQRPQPTQTSEVDSSYGLQGKIASFLNRNRDANPKPAARQQQRTPTPVPRVESKRQVAAAPTRVAPRADSPNRSLSQQVAQEIRAGRGTVKENSKPVGTGVGRAIAVNDRAEPDATYIGAFVDNSRRGIRLTAQEETAEIFSPPTLPTKSRPRISNSPRAKSYSSQDRVPSKTVSVFSDWQEEDASNTPFRSSPTQDSSPFSQAKPFGESKPLPSLNKSPEGLRSQMQGLGDSGQDAIESKQDFGGTADDSQPDRLPARPLYTPQDDDLEEAARRARSRAASELDSLDDDDMNSDELDDDNDFDLDDEDDDDKPNPTPTEKSCAEFREILLKTKIQDISLDISPPASDRRYNQAGISRNWTDRNGTVLATGTMMDLRRGYVILDSGQKIAYGRLSESDLAAVSEYWLIPTVCGIGNRGSTYRSWTPQSFTWKASGLCHKPLFFENIQLERYGHSRGPVLQPIHSTVHFFKSLVTIPYQTSITPANECQYALGFYRPGSCAPWLIDPISITEKGIKRQALFMTGAAFLP